MDMRVANEAQFFHKPKLPLIVLKLTDRLDYIPRLGWDFDLGTDKSMKIAPMPYIGSKLIIMQSLMILQCLL